MTQNAVIDAYFEWMYDLVCRDRFSKDISYRKLLIHLHNTEFIYLIPIDANRAEDGINLRYRFAYDRGWSFADSYLDGPCSVLEMMVALAIRCEEDYMDDAIIGNRTGQWFWTMITSLGLGHLDDARFNRMYARDVIATFLKRDYEPNGKGGLFTIRNCREDLRDVDIWHQMLRFLNTIT